MKYLVILFIFISCLCNLVNARVYAGGAIGISIGSLIILILDTIAIVDILRTPRPILNKFLWILLIIVFPIGGLLIWLFCGRKTDPII